MNDGGPVFPQLTFDLINDKLVTLTDLNQPGMSLRDYASIHLPLPKGALDAARAGEHRRMLADRHCKVQERDGQELEMELRFQRADAWLAEREKSDSHR